RAGPGARQRGRRAGAGGIRDRAGSERVPDDPARRDTVRADRSGAGGRGERVSVPMAYALSLSVDQDLLALGRAVGELRRRNLTIIGYGSQGHAHARNLRESGVTVIVGLRPGGASWARAVAEKLDVRPVADAARAANFIMMLVPDQHGRAVYEQDVAAGVVPGKTLMFAHGFNVHFKQIVPPAGVDVSMVAPKSPGHLVRSEFQAGRGVPALVAGESGASGH